MLSCKECHSSHVVKNGFVRGVQRYHCKACSLNFIQGDGRTSPKIAAKKALVILLYALGKASFNMLEKIWGILLHSSIVGFVTPWIPRKNPWFPTQGDGV